MTREDVEAMDSESFQDLNFCEEFTSSITRMGSVLTPHRIKITNDIVTWSKRNSVLIGVDSTQVKRASITSVDIVDNVIGCDIVIHAQGHPNIIATNFSGSDAQRIRELILNK
jgi:hypothetical protein